MGVPDVMTEHAFPRNVRYRFLPIADFANEFETGQASQGSTEEKPVVLRVISDENGIQALKWLMLGTF